MKTTPITQGLSIHESDEGTRKGSVKEEPKPVPQTGTIRDPNYGHLVSTEADFKKQEEN